ncbi:MAG: T9SS type A sorting domain-containing protein [Saprospiraceae bacterium]|nr:T9SS type A sorting domain-containing protein [Saprospiraceae bacterium]
MKKFLLIACLLAAVQTASFADAGYTDPNAAKINLQTTNGSDNYLAASVFNGSNQGTFSYTSYLHLKAAEAWVFKNNSSDVTGGNFNYRVYKQGSSPGSFNFFTFNWQEENASSGTTYQRWGNYGVDINLLTGVNSPGTWVFECYWSAPTNGVNCSNPIFLSNSGSNYSFSFTADATFPVELSMFKIVSVSNDKPSLHWRTASELDNSHFEVERSADSRRWQAIGEVTGKGTSFGENNYYFTDEQPLQGTNYYRLKQVDFDGDFEYSKVISTVVGRGTVGSVSLFPNPTADLVTIQLPDADGSCQVTLFDLTGKRWLDAPLNGNSLNISYLPTGTYLLVLRDENGQQLLHERLVKQ